MSFCISGRHLHRDRHSLSRLSLLEVADPADRPWLPYRHAAWHGTGCAARMMQGARARVSIASRRAYARVNIFFIFTFLCPSAFSRFASETATLPNFAFQSWKVPLDRPCLRHRCELFGLLTMLGREADDLLVRGLVRFIVPLQAGRPPIDGGEEMPLGAHQGCARPAPAGLLAKAQPAVLISAGRRGW